MNNKFEQWFKDYGQCFVQGELDTICRYYAFPSVMTTPDKVVIMRNQEDLYQQLGQILTFTQQNKTTSADFSLASVDQINDELYIIDGHWKIQNNQQEVFADFGAVYHLKVENQQIKIINVASYYLD